MNKYRKALIGSFIFFLTIFVLLFVRDLYNESKYRTYNSLVVFEMPSYWKLTPEELEQDTKQKARQNELAREAKNTKQEPTTINKQKQVPKEPHTLLNTSSHSITRQQLGRQTWTLLHMISGQMPDDIDELLREKINIFLNLFGQFYPCKLCGTHFLGHIKKFPFAGSTKKDYMVYVCDLHNVVNRMLHKPEYSCSKIEEEWSACGCSSDSIKTDGAQ